MSYPVNVADGTTDDADSTDTAGSTDIADRERAIEQTRLDLLYVHLDALRVQAQERLADLRLRPTAGTPAAVTEREAFVRQFAGRVAALEAVEERLMFGRLDLLDGEVRYVGRIGISDDDHDQLLVDWRAPAAEPFYQATAANPLGVVRRRSVNTVGRRVTGVQDEVLDLGAFEASGVQGSQVVVGDGALFASLDLARSGRMRDIVATIQADQDRAIRSPLAGVLVVQGGPGTGKTAVALHRAAFLLYANRERIERSGVLVVGPNRVFLRYIEAVLPALGEAEAVLMRTPAELYPGVVADGREPPETSAVKGDPRMAEVIQEAVRRRERVPSRPKILAIEGTVIRLRPGDVRSARDRARRSGQPHNQARVGFVKEVLRGLVRSLANARNAELDDDARAGYLNELYESVDVRREVNWCWPPVGPERLLRDLFADPERLNEAGRVLTADERALLRRDRRAPWTIADVALLDEAAELLGTDETASPVQQAATAQAEADRRAEASYAADVQQTFGGADFMSAADLATRYGASERLGVVAERAGADRQWAFGHIVVDEAQELSPMMWRLLIRRSPSRSLTVVGDVAQTSALSGASSWGTVLSPYVGERWSLAELTVNYRTPGLIMELAGRVVAAAGLDVTVPESAREGAEDAVVHTRLSSLTGPGLVAAVQDEWRRATPGTVGVVTSRRAHADVAAAVAAGLPAGTVSADSDALATPVSVLTVADAKGLEFDCLVLVEPADILTESPRGANDLYVAMTRPTRRLHVLHEQALPAGFDGSKETDPQASL